MRKRPPQPSPQSPWKTNQAFHFSTYNVQEVHMVCLLQWYRLFESKQKDYMYVVVNFLSQVLLFFFCLNFISIHYHTQKQKKNKNYLRWKINYNMYINKS